MKADIRKHALIAVLSPAALLTVLGGCANFSRPQVISESFGLAQTASVQAQTLYPDREADLNPVVGINGTASVTAMKAYTESFKAKESGADPNKMFIGLGGIGGGK